MDLDPIVLAHGGRLLAAEKNTTVATADMRRPDEVLKHPETTRFIDFGEPVGVLLIAMVHFLTTDERPAVMSRLREALPPGSHLAATHVTVDDNPAEAAAKIEEVYAATPTPVYFRTHAKIARFFDEFELVEPGLVTFDRWRPDPSDPAHPAGRWAYGAVGVLP